MQRARDTATTSRLIIEKRTTRRARPENCGPSSRLLHTRLFAERAGTREGNKGRGTRSVLCGSRAFANDFRDKFPARLYERPGAHENASPPDFTRERQRLFRVRPYVCVHIYTHTYIQYISRRNLFAINPARNRTRYRTGFDSGVEKIWVSVRASSRETSKGERKREKKLANVGDKA